MPCPQEMQGDSEGAQSLQARVWNQNTQFMIQIWLRELQPSWTMKIHPIASDPCCNPFIVRIIFMDKLENEVFTEHGSNMKTIRQEYETHMTLGAWI